MFHIKNHRQHWRSFGILAAALMLSSVAAVSRAESASSVYRVSLTLQQNDLQLAVCIDDGCQKSLSYQKVEDGYLYDFGTFAISDHHRFPVYTWTINLAERRVRRLLEAYLPDGCTIASCGSFTFQKVDAPVTSTDACEAGVAACPRDRIIR